MHRLNELPIVVTGSTGFVGRNLTDYFSQQSIFHQTVSLRQGNWKEQVVEAGVIIHLAGINEGEGSPSEFNAVNCQLTVSLFNAFLKSKAKKFIYFSSIKALSDQDEGKPLNESMEKKASTPYALSKSKAEEQLINTTLPEGKTLLILRPCLIHGPENEGNLYQLYRMINNGIPYPFGAVNNLRSMLSIYNLCFVVKELVSQPIASGIYHVADSKFISSVEIVKIIGECIGRPVKLWSVNKKYLIFIGKIGAFLHLPFNSKTVQKLSKNYRVDNYKILNALKIELPYSVEDGIRKTIKSYQNNRK